MLTVFHSALVAGTLAVATLASPAHALLMYAPSGQQATLQGGGEAMSASTIVEGASSLSFNSINVASQNYEFLNVLPATVPLPPTLILTEGTSNNGQSFSIDFLRTSGPAPLGQSGTIDFVITNTNTIDVLDLPGGTQAFFANFNINLVATSTYVSPKAGVLTISGSSSTATPQVNYNYSIVIPGSANPTVSEPAMLAIIGGGLLTIGAIRHRRRR